MPTLPSCRFASRCTPDFGSATRSWLLFSPTSQPLPDHRATLRRLARCQAEGQPTWLENAAAPDTPSPVPEGSLERLPPWNLSFDIRERETDWTDENKVSTPCAWERIPLLRGHVLVAKCTQQRGVGIAGDPLLCHHCLNLGACHHNDDMQ